MFTLEYYARLTLLGYTQINIYSKVANLNLA